MKAKILIILTLLAIFTFSCNKDEYCILTEAQKQIIPYKEGEVISFIDKAGVTVDLTVTKSQEKWIKERIDAAFGNSYYIIEQKSVILESESNNLRVCLTLESIDGHKPPNPCAFLIEINNEVRFLMISNAKGDFRKTDNSITLHERMKINNTVYYDVVEKNENSMQLFYNKAYGILQINNANENFLTLKL